MRVLLFDPFSGASGDMILGALLDLGLDAGRLRAALARLPLDPFEFEIARVTRHGLSGTRCRVVVRESGDARDWGAIRDLLTAAPLPPAARERALAVFANLAEAEAAVHGVPVERVHFHEVGGTDAVVDVVGACLGFALLGVEGVFSEAPQVGRGFVRAAHGVLPVPAPATAALLAKAGAPLPPALPEQADAPGELLTPTGAAILTTLAEFRRPPFAPLAVGYGFGAKELPWPNALRAWLGEIDAAAKAAAEVILETNLDDMNPQFAEPLLERLFEAGALDVWLTPVVMKKGRPGLVVSVLAPEERRQALVALLIEHSTTLGVRARPIDRVKAARRFETVTTRWGDVRLKLRGWKGRVIDAMPEYDDCLALARAADIPIRAVWNEAHRMGEVYVGQKWSPERPPGLRVVDFSRPGGSEDPP